jgi:hypothetical protein
MIPREMPVSRQLQSELERELAPGECVVWSGQPIPSRYSRGTWPIVLFGIPWTAFALFWTGGAFWGTRQIPSDDAMATGFRWLFPLFGLPFILVGVGMLSSPWWLRRKAGRVLYAVTDRRAILFEPAWRGARKVRSFEPAALQALERTEHSDGSGDLIFTRDAWRDSDGDRRTSQVGFTGVPRVREVEEVIRKLAAGR